MNFETTKFLTQLKTKMDEIYSFTLQQMKKKELEYDQIEDVVKKINSFYTQVSNIIMKDLS